MAEELENTSKNQVVRNEKGQIIQGSGNPAGRPKGVKNFKTIFEEAVKKIAKERNLKDADIEVDLVIRAISEARGGSYKYYRDIFDRIYGKPQETFKVGIDEPIEKITIEIVKNKNGN